LAATAAALDGLRAEAGEARAQALLTVGRLPVLVPRQLGARPFQQQEPRDPEHRDQDRGRREGWLAEAIEETFSDEERQVLNQAVGLLARLAEL